MAVFRRKLHDRFIASFPSLSHVNSLVWNSLVTTHVNCQVHSPLFVRRACPRKVLVQFWPWHPPLGLGGPETLKAEGSIFENCLKNKRCSAGCKLALAAQGTSASIYIKWEDGCMFLCLLVRGGLMEIQTPAPFFTHTSPPVQGRFRCRFDLRPLPTGPGGGP